MPTAADALHAYLTDRAAHDAFPGVALLAAVLLSNLEDGVWQPMHFVAAQIEAGEWGTN